MDVEFDDGFSFKCIRVLFSIKLPVCTILKEYKSSFLVNGFIAFHSISISIFPIICVAIAVAISDDDEELFFHQIQFSLGSREVRKSISYFWPEGKNISWLTSYAKLIHSLTCAHTCSSKI